MNWRSGHNDRILCCATCILIVVSHCSQVLSDEAFELTSLVGDVVAADIVAIDSKGAVKLKAGEQALASLREIRRVDQTDLKPAGGIEIQLVDGGKVFASQVTTDEESCTVSGHGLFDSPLKLPIDLVHAVVMQPKNVSAEVRESLAESREDDRLFLLIDGNVETIDGLIESVTDSEVNFSWNDKARKLPRAQLLAIGVAASGAKPDGNCQVDFADGSSLPSKVISLKDDELKIAVHGEPHVVSWQRVASITVRSDRLKFLSDMKPTVYEHIPIVTSKREWKKDRSVNGAMMRLGAEAFSKGLGVASETRLEFQLDGNAKKFCATIGIDAETEGRGDCVFVVHGDGRPLAREAIKGTDEPKKLQIDIASVRKLELIVEAGNDLDLADHANWCDACLLSD